MKARQESKQKSPRIVTATRKRFNGFSEEEKGAMKDRIMEGETGGDGEEVVLAKIAQMREPDRTMGKRVHAIIKASAPELVPRLWYGMPAYARPGKDGKVVCFFQPGQKFKTRYSTLGFSDKANLDEGDMWPVAFALKELTNSEAAKIGVLVKRAAS